MNGKDELSVPQSAAVQGPVAMYYTAVSCQLSGGDQRQLTACNTSYHPALSPVNPHTINGPSYSSGHAEARYFIVSCSGRKCDEDRDTKQRVTLFSVSVTAILSHPSLACLGLK